MVIICLLYANIVYIKCAYIFLLLSHPLSFLLTSSLFHVQSVASNVAHRGSSVGAGSNNRRRRVNTENITTSDWSSTQVVVRHKVNGKVTRPSREKMQTNKERRTRGRKRECVKQKHYRVSRRQRQRWLDISRPTTAMCGVYSAHKALEQPDY